MAVRTRKSPLTLPVDPTVEPPAAAPTRRRVQSPRATTTRRPATSSRTLRPVLPPEELVLPEPAAEPEAEAPVSRRAKPAAEPVQPPVAQPEVDLQPKEEPPVALPAVEPLPVDLQPIVPLPVAPLPVLPVAPLPVAPPPIAPSPAPVPATSESTPSPAVALALGLPLMVEQLQADVRALQGMVADRTEQTAQDLGRTTMQMVRMVTGVAHHLDQLAEQVQQLSGVAQTLAQALTRVESTVAALRERAQDQLALSARGQLELKDVLSPVLSELIALRVQGIRNTSIERVDEFRRSVELKQLREAIEKHGPTSELLATVPRVSRASRAKR
jgi:hypothetical protein